VKFFALAALLLAVPAAAQDRAAEIDFENALRDSKLKSVQDRAAVERTIVAMNDGVEAGEKIVSYMREHGIEVSVASQKEASKTTVENGKTRITLSDALPAYPRVYGPLIAKEIAALMFADMPACAERSYMRRATAGRVWTELGGEPSKLPVVEPLSGDKVSAVTDEISVWTANGAEMALYKIGEAEKLGSIPELEQAAGKQELIKLGEANARFVAFLIDEKPARKAAGLR
jgi:hypothetical protein